MNKKKITFIEKMKHRTKVYPGLLQISTLASLATIVNRVYFYWKTAPSNIFEVVLRDTS